MADNPPADMYPPAIVQARLCALAMRRDWFDQRRYWSDYGIALGLGLGVSQQEVGYLADRLAGTDGGGDGDDFEPDPDSLGLPIEDVFVTGDNNLRLKIFLIDSQIRPVFGVRLDNSDEHPVEETARDAFSPLMVACYAWLLEVICIAVDVAGSDLGEFTHDLALLFGSHEWSSVRDKAAFHVKAFFPTADAYYEYSEACGYPRDRLAVLCNDLPPETQDQLMDMSLENCHDRLAPTIRAFINATGNEERLDFDAGGGGGGGAHHQAAFWWRDPAVTTTTVTVVGHHTVTIRELAAQIMALTSEFASRGWSSYNVGVLIEDVNNDDGDSDSNIGSWRLRVFGVAERRLPRRKRQCRFLRRHGGCSNDDAACTFRHDAWFS